MLQKSLIQQVVEITGLKNIFFSIKNYFQGSRDHIMLANYSREPLFLLTYLRYFIFGRISKSGKKPDETPHYLGQGLLALFIDVK